MWQKAAMTILDHWEMCAVRNSALDRLLSHGF